MKTAEVRFERTRKIVFLQNINNQIKFGSTEYHIIQLLEKSEKVEDDQKLTLTWYSYEGNSGTAGGNELKYDEYKERQKFQAKQYNQKIKQYENKGRFRK